MNCVPYPRCSRAVLVAGASADGLIHLIFFAGLFFYALWRLT
jgi:hypothetical protein